MRRDQAPGGPYCPAVDDPSVLTKVLTFPLTRPAPCPSTDPSLTSLPLPAQGKIFLPGIHLLKANEKEVEE